VHFDGIVSRVVDVNCAFVYFLIGHLGISIAIAVEIPLNCCDGIIRIRIARLIGKLDGEGRSAT